MNRSVHRWRDATLVREFSFAPGAFADGPVERRVALVVREADRRDGGATDEATRTVTFRRVDGGDGGGNGGDSEDGDAADATGGTELSPTGPFVGLRP